MSDSRDVFTIYQDVATVTDMEIGTGMHLTLGIGANKQPWGWPNMVTAISGKFAAVKPIKHAELMLCTSVDDGH